MERESVCQPKRVDHRFSGGSQIFNRCKTSVFNLPTTFPCTKCLPDGPPNNCLSIFFIEKNKKKNSYLEDSFCFGLLQGAHVHFILATLERFCPRTHPAWQLRGCPHLRSTPYYSKSTDSRWTQLPSVPTLSYAYIKLSIWQQW